MFNCRSAKSSVGAEQPVRMWSRTCGRMKGRRQDRRSNIHTRNVCESKSSVNCWKIKTPSRRLLASGNVDVVPSQRALKKPENASADSSTGTRRSQRINSTRLDNQTVPDCGTGAGQTALWHSYAINSETQERTIAQMWWLYYHSRVTGVPLTGHLSCKTFLISHFLLLNLVMIHKAIESRWNDVVLLHTWP